MRAFHTGILSFLYFGVFTDAKDIVHRNLVKGGQLNQNIRGNVPLTKLVVAVDLLGAVQALGQILLGQIPILPQIPNSFIDHGISISYVCKKIITNREMQY